MADTQIYTIYKTDGTVAFSIQPRTFNGVDGIAQNTDLTLYGNAQPQWGERFNENFYHMLENFACEDVGGNVPSAVTHPIEGMTWYNRTNSTLCVYDGADWNPVAGGIAISDIPGLDSALDGKVDKAGGVGGVMTGKLTVQTADAIEASSSDGTHIDSKVTTTGTTAPGFRLYNADNDPAVGGTHGTNPWTILTNRDALILSIEAAETDLSMGSAGSRQVLYIRQDGEMFFQGHSSGSPHAGPYNGDIRLPNATVTELTHATTKEYVDDAITAATGGDYVDTTGDTMTGPLEFSGTGLPLVWDNGDQDIRAHDGYGNSQWTTGVTHTLKGDVDNNSYMNTTWGATRLMHSYEGVAPNILMYIYPQANSVGKVAGDALDTADGAVYAWYADRYDNGGKRIRNVQDPAINSDAATRGWTITQDNAAIAAANAYTDTQVGGIGGDNTSVTLVYNGGTTGVVNLPNGLYAVEYSQSGGTFKRYHRVVMIHSSFTTAGAYALALNDTSSSMPEIASTGVQGGALGTDSVVVTRVWRIE